MSSKYYPREFSSYEENLEPEMEDKKMTDKVKENEMEEKDYKMSDNQVAIELAEKLYEKFFNELMTAMRNSIKNFESAMWSTCDGNAISYYQGKMHAFKEISERLVKEYNLVLNNNLHYDDSCEKMLYDIKNRKNEEMEHIIPTNRYRGTDWVMRLRGKFADLLEAFSSRAFMLGLKFGKNENKETDKFDPVSFEKLCNDRFVGEHYMFAVRYMEDPEFRKEVDANS